MLQQPLLSHRDAPGPAVAPFTRRSVEAWPARLAALVVHIARRLAAARQAQIARRLAAAHQVQIARQTRHRRPSPWWHDPGTPRGL
jgi:hypothetical protein